MEGRTRIQLMQPGTVSTNAYGETSSDPIVSSYRALRRDRGGRIEQTPTEQVGIWEREYELRFPSGIEITIEWLLRDLDDFNRVFRIESISRVPNRKIRLRVASR